MSKTTFCSTLPLRFTSAFSMLALLSIIMTGCGGSSSNPVMSLVAEAENTNLVPGAENTNTQDFGNNSLFTGKLIFSTSFARPLNIFNFNTNTFDLSLEGDAPQDSLLEADLDPTATYAAYTLAPGNGLIAGKAQVVLRDNSLNQEFRLPFETGDPDQSLTSSKPSVSSIGIVVFEYSTFTISDDGFPIGTANAGIAYWNGSGQLIKLADSASDPSSPRITEDGNTVYFVADSDSGRAIWKTSLASDIPVIVWAPSSGERLAPVLQVFDISNDGSTIAIGVQRGSQIEIQYITSTGQRKIEFAETNNTTVNAFRLSGDGSKLIALTYGANEQVGIMYQLHVANVADGNVIVAEDSSREGTKFNPGFLLPALAVSYSGDGVAMLNLENNGDPFDISLFAFRPGEFSNAQQRIVSDADYDGLTIIALSMRFRGD